jgi:rubrerythrin
MNRLLITLAVLFIVFSLLRALRKGSRGDRHSGTAPRRPDRGAPRALVCGECGTQFAPDARGWICPKCGK